MAKIGIASVSICLVLSIFCASHVEADDILDGASCGVLNSRVNASSQHSEKHCVLFYRAVTTVSGDASSAMYYPVSDALDWDVCNETELPPPSLPLENHLIFVSSENNCSALERAKRVKMLGGAGALVVKEKLNVPRLNSTQESVMLAFIRNTSYMQIIEEGEDVEVGLYSPPDTLFPFSLIIIWVLAVFSITVGAFWSGIVRHELYLNEQVGESEGGEGGGGNSGGERRSSMPKEETSMDLSAKSILFFVVLMCAMLLSLYFLFDYLVYLIIGMFCLASGVAMFCVLHPLVSRIPCGDCRTPYFNIYLVRGTLELRQILLLIFSFGLVGVWVAFRKAPWAWILQDTLGIAFCINVMRLVRLPNLKICTILLSSLIIYDIFFVFITPLLTSDSKSIMVEVAKGGSSKEQLPMVLKVPNFAYAEISNVCNITDNYNLLGFGDILIPGLLISYVHSFDLQVASPCRLYYFVNIVGYGVGLVVTFIALWLMNFAQPALLYLVPFTLIPTYITAAIRGEVKAMWRGDADKFESYGAGDSGPEEEEGEGEEDTISHAAPTAT